MNIKVIKENIWYSSVISDFWIFTQGDTFEELIKNMKEALELYYEDSFKNKVIFNEFNEFNLVLN